MQAKVLCLFFALAVCASAGWRATWIGSGSLPTAEQTDSFFAELASAGINRAYVDVYNNGYTFFNSPTFASVAGPNGINKDVLAWAIAAGKKHGIDVIPWFEYSLQASANCVKDTQFEQYIAAQKWVLGCAEGKTWLDARNPKVLEFIANLMKDALKYGVSAVQLDDHFGQPVTLVKGSQIMDNAIRTIVKLVGGSKISLAPAVSPFSIQHYNIDWTKWTNLGIKEFVPQLYTSDMAALQKLYATNVAPIHGTVIPGLKGTGGGVPVSWNLLRPVLQYAKTHGGNFAIWEARSVIAHKNELKAFLAGSPKFLEEEVELDA